MDALKLAFDTIIVGALALPWLALIIDFYLFSRGESFKVLSPLQQAGSAVPQAVSAVLLFTAAYFLGAAVSRISGDLFNDDDLGQGVTEDRIRAEVYCNPANLPPSVKPFEFCRGANRLIGARKAFDQQEAEVLLQGSDKIETISQLHAQISVLRGATLNGLLVCILCVFGICGRLKGWNRLWALIPIAGLSGLAVHAILGHLGHMTAADLPFTESTLVAVALAGCLVLPRGAPDRKYGAGLLLSLLLTGLGFCAWCWTEVLYDQQVLHSSYALTMAAPGKQVPAP